MATIAHKDGDTGQYKAAPTSQSKFRIQPSDGQVLQQLLASPHRYKGIAASVADAKNTPVFPIALNGDPINFATLDNTLGDAMRWWPGETDWTVYGADAAFSQAHVDGLEFPSGSLMLRAPQDLFTFTATE